MKLLVRRTYRNPDYTIGHLYINGRYFCDTVEDTDRSLTQDMPLSKIMQIKVKGKTCIPYGTYRITLNVVSGKYSNYIKYPYAKDIKGKMPRLLNVPGFDGILIHPGTTAKDTDGCLVTGENKIKGGVINSVVTWKKLCAILFATKEDITITYTK